MMTLPATLISAQRNGKLIPFVGSGVSLGVKKDLFPTWPQLIDSLARRLDEEAKSNDAALVRAHANLNRLYEAAGEALRGLGKARFNDVMQHHFRIDRPLNADLSVPQNVLSWANPAAKRLMNHQTSELATVRQSTADRPIIWHLHGHISEADTLVLAPNQYRKLYDADVANSQYCAALQQLRSVITDSVFLFLGFGLNDEYVMELLREVFEMFDGALPPSFAIQSRERLDASSIWTKFGVECISVENFGESLRTLLSELATIPPSEAMTIRLESAASANITLQAVGTAAYSPANACFTVPHRRKGDKAIGHTETLDDLRESFLESSSKYGNAVVVQGFGGIGKTQVAVEYAFEFQSAYPNGVIWLEADGDLESQLTRLAVEANWVHPDTEHRDKLEIAANRLKKYSDCLIVFDNVSSLAEIERFLPLPSANPHLLMTSQVELPGIEPFPIEVLELNDAVEMLRSESGRNFEAEGDLAVATEIAELLGRTPLALELSGAYLKHRPTVALRDYAESLEHEFRDTLQKSGRHLASFTGHDADVFRTILQTEKVLNDEEHLQSILDVLTWSGATSIGESLLAALVGVEPHKLSQALGLAASLRIVEAIETSPHNDRRYRIHRLVAQVRRDEFAKKMPSEAISKICHRLGSWFEKIRLDFVQLPAFEAEFDHLVAWLKNAEGLSKFEEARLTWLKAYPPYYRGKYEAAETPLQRAFDLLNSIHESERADEVLLLESHIRNDLATILAELDRGDGIVEHYRRAVEIRKSVLGENAPETAMCLSNWAIQLKDPNERLKYELEALRIREQSLGEANEWTSNSYRNVSLCYLALDKNDDAISSALKAVNSARSLRGSGIAEHPELGRAKRQLSDCYLAAGDKHSALAAASEGLAILQRALGENHPDTLRSHQQDGRCLYRLEKYEECVAISRDVLRRTQETWGDRHRKTCDALANLAHALLAAGQPKEALPVAIDSYNIAEGNYGAASVEMTPFLNIAGRTSFIVGRWHEALKYSERELGIWRLTAPPTNTNAVQCAINVAKCLIKVTRSKDSLLLLLNMKRKISKEHSEYSELVNLEKELTDKDPVLRQFANEYTKQRTGAGNKKGKRR